MSDGLNGSNGPKVAQSAYNLVFVVIFYTLIINKKDLIMQMKRLHAGPDRIDLLPNLTDTPILLSIAARGCKT